jgi:hypothetical protein
VIVAAPARVPVARPVTLDVSVGVAASVGLVPRVCAGPVARFTIRVGAFSTGVEARGDVGLGGLAVGTSGAASVQLWRGALFACAHAGLFALCGVASGGAFAAQGEGLAASRAGVVPWASLGARVGVERRLAGLFFLRAFLDVEAPLVHPSLLLDGVNQWTASPVAASLGVLVGATIP